MSDKDRESFEAFVRRGTREGEDFLERDSHGEYLLGVARGKAVSGGITYSGIISALRAAGVQFRDEPNPEPGACP